MESFGQVAVKSKEQGDSVDYRVLARSEGPLTTTDFESCYDELNVGAIKEHGQGAAPTDAAPLGGRAPWMTIGPFNAAGSQYVAVIRQDWTSRHDVQGRPVAAQYCLCLPYDVLAEQGPGYLNLDANFPPPQLFFEATKELLDAPALSFEPLAGGAKDILKRVDEVGFDFCAFVAASILASPVAIVGGQRLGMQARLSFFDAVASLLPYGARAELGVSTWMNSTNVSKIHIAFTDYVLPNQKRVVWQEAKPKELKPETVAGEYYELLHKLWGDPQADKGQIISDLAAKRTPYTFGEARRILGALRDVNWEKLVYDEVKSEQGTKEEVRELFKAGRGQRLPPEQGNDLLFFLLDQQPLELVDVEILRKNWDESFWVQACELVRQELQAPVFQEEILWALCGVAAEKGWLEKFIDALLKPDRLKSLTPTLKLFYKAIKEFEYDEERVGFLLRRDPKFFYGLLFMVGGTLETHDELGGLLSWLGKGEDFAKTELAAFQVATGARAEDAAPETLEALAARDTQYVERLFRIAVTRYHLTQDCSAVWHLTPAVSLWLLRRWGRIQPEETLRWEEHLRLMRTIPQPSMELAARLDVLSLAMRGSERVLMVEGLLREGPGPRAQQYADEFVRDLSLPGLDSQQIIRRLVEHLNRLQFDPNEARTDLDLLAKLMPVVRGEHIKVHLVGHLSRVISKHPALLTHDSFEQEIRGRLLDWRKREQLLEILYAAFGTAARAGGSVKQVVELYAQMSELAMQSLEERATRVLSESNYLDDIKRIDYFVEAVQKSLEKVTETPEAAWAKTRELQKYLFGIKSEPMAEYLERYVNYLFESLRDADELLDLTVEQLDEGRAEHVRETLSRMRDGVPVARRRGFRGRK